jgi:hypothetical protein
MKYLLMDLLVRWRGPSIEQLWETNYYHQIQMISGIRLCIFISFIFAGCQGQPTNINIQKLAEYARDTVWLEFKPSTKTTNPKSYDFLSLTEMSAFAAGGGAIYCRL